MASTHSVSVPAHALTARNYQSVQDFIQMRELLMEARLQTSDWRYAHVGELQFNFFMVVCHLNPQEFVRLWHVDGKLVGYAILGDDPAFDYQILPKYEWIGIEAEALSWAEARLAQLRHQDAKRWGGRLVSGSRQDNPGRIAFLEQNGFHYCGEFPEVNLLRSLAEPIPDTAIPAGFVVREVTDAETPQQAATTRAVWLPWSVGDISAENFGYFMKMPGYQRELNIVAVAPDGTHAAYVNGWIDPVNRIGDLGPVGAVPEYRRQGLTRAVLLECLRRMKKAGMDRVCISTGITNTPARNLYESIGFKPVNQYLDYIKE